MFNKIQILGVIVRDIELKITNSGTAIASFSIACNESRKQPDGSYADVPHFFEVTAFGKKAETINSHFRKGSKILIDGSLNQQTWKTESGENRSKVGIKLNDFEFIDRKQNEILENSVKPEYSQQPRKMMPEQNIPVIDIDESELPF